MKEYSIEGNRSVPKNLGLVFLCAGDPVVFDITAMTIFADSNVAFVIATMHCTEPGGHKTIGFIRVEMNGTLVKGGHNHMVDRLHQMADNSFNEFCFCNISLYQFP